MTANHKHARVSSLTDLIATKLLPLVQIKANLRLRRSFVTVGVADWTILKIKVAFKVSTTVLTKQACHTKDTVLSNMRLPSSFSFSDSFETLRALVLGN